MYFQNFAYKERFCSSNHVLSQSHWLWSILGNWLVHNQYDVTIYRDVKIDWFSVLVPLVFVGLTRLFQNFQELIRAYETGLCTTSMTSQFTVTSKLIDFQFLFSWSWWAWQGCSRISKNWSEPTRLAEDTVGTAKTFPVSKILKVVLKFKKSNYLIFKSTSLYIHCHLGSKEHKKNMSLNQSMWLHLNLKSFQLFNYALITLFIIITIFIIYSYTFHQYCIN